MRHFMIAACAFVLIALNAAMSFAAVDDDIRIIGYSKDGRYFAYETFGVSDGSGSPYAAIYVLDVANDTSAEGTPVRSEFGEEEHPTALPAQMQVRQIAAPILAKLDIRYPWRELASVSAGQQVSGPHELQFKRYTNISDLRTVKLMEFDLDAAQKCSGQTKGFALAIAKGGEPLTEVYRNKRLPKSRYCSQGYKLARVIDFGNERTQASVVLVHKFSPGFEGMGASFVAIPVMLPTWR